LVWTESKAGRLKKTARVEYEHYFQITDWIPVSKLTESKKGGLIEAL